MSFSPSWRLIAALLVAACAASCTVPLKEPIAGYTCCNLREYSGWVSSNNVQGGTLVPAGSPITVESIKRGHFAYATLDGVQVGLRDDQSRLAVETLAWLQRVVVPNDPRQAAATWPREMRTAAQLGKVVPGMTRAQVLYALGHPAREDTPDPALPTWVYWTALGDERVTLTFGGDGQLAGVSGKPAAVRIMLMEP